MHDLQLKFSKALEKLTRLEALKKPSYSGSMKILVYLLFRMTLTRHDPQLQIPEEARNLKAQTKLMRLALITGAVPFPR